MDPIQLSCQFNPHGSRTESPYQESIPANMGCGGVYCCRWSSVACGRSGCSELLFVSFSVKLKLAKECKINHDAFDRQQGITYWRVSLQLISNPEVQQVLKMQFWNNKAYFRTKAELRSFSLWSEKYSPSTPRTEDKLWWSRNRLEESSWKLTTGTDEYYPKRFLIS